MVVVLFETNKADGKLGWGVARIYHEDTLSNSGLMPEAAHGPGAEGSWKREEPPAPMQGYVLG